jgi:hypothetical protein
VTVGRLQQLEELLIGCALNRCVRQEFWFEGELEEHCNALYLQCSGARTVRLVLDSGVFAWYVADPEPASVESPGELRLIDITEGLDGQSIESLRLSQSPGTSAELVVELSGGSGLVLQNREDRSSLLVRAA